MAKRKAQPAPETEADPVTNIDDTAASTTTEPTAEPDTATEEPESPTWEAWDSPEIMDLQINWSEKSEIREIATRLTEEEREEAGNSLADTITRIRELEDEKKTCADNFKSLIVAVEKQQNELCDLIKRGNNNKRIPCRWMFEVAGRDDTGRFIRDQNYKTLVRLDSGAVVTTQTITQAERQMNLPLEEVPALATDSEGNAPIEAMPDAGTVNLNEAGEEPEITPPTPEIFEARQFGREAHAAEKTTEDNPYADGTDEQAAWDEGWMDADSNAPL